MKKASREWGLYGKLFQTSAVCDSPCIFILRVSRTVCWAIYPYKNERAPYLIVALHSDE